MQGSADVDSDMESFIQGERSIPERAGQWRLFIVVLGATNMLSLFLGAGFAHRDKLPGNTGPSGRSTVEDVKNIIDAEAMPNPCEVKKTIYIIRHGEKIYGDVSKGQLAYEAQCLSELGWARAYNLKSIFGQRPRPPFKTPDALFSGNYEDPIDCRDKHGWYRTQQVISALASDAPGGLNMVVDNTTGWMPAFCGLTWNVSSKPGYLEHKASSQPEPYKSFVMNWTAAQPIGGTCSPKAVDGGNGMCCNPAAAKKMLAKLAQPGINTILVAWEHSNIVYLAKALGAPKDAELPWPGDDFDRVYTLTYNAQGAFESINTNQFQGFDYPTSGPHQVGFIGPKTYCGAIDKTSYPVNYPVQDRVSPLPTGYVIEAK
jgi:hypothetical protein